MKDLQQKKIINGINDRIEVLSNEMKKSSKHMDNRIDDMSKKMDELKDLLTKNK